MQSIDLIVSRHDGTGLSCFDSDHEWQQVDLAESTIGDHRAHSHTLVFLVVTDKVLETGNNVLFLDSIAVCAGEYTREQRVLGVRLEASATERTSLDVDCRSKDDMGAFGFRLVGEEVANTVDQVFVKGRSDGSATWETCGRRASIEVCSANAIGAIRSAN